MTHGLYWLERDDKLDFKLPFTALAGIIAAAVQASGTTAGFGTACTWSLVILVAAVEAILSVLKQRALWPPWQKCAVGLAAIAIAAAIVGALNWQAYRKEYLTEDLRVILQSPHPGQIGTDQLALNFLIAAKAPSSMILEEVAAVTVASTDFSNNPARNSALCKLLGWEVIGKQSTEGFAHPNQKVLHVSRARPPQSLAAANENFSGNPPFPDNDQLDVAIFEPKSISINGKESAPGPVELEAGKAVAVTARFETDPASWNTHNVMTLCGGIRYLSSDGRETSAVCPVQVRARIFQQGKQTGESSGPLVMTPYVFGSSSDDTRCGVWKGP